MTGETEARRDAILNQLNDSTATGQGQRQVDGGVLVDDTIDNYSEWRGFPLGAWGGGRGTGRKGNGWVDGGFVDDGIIRYIEWGGFHMLWRRWESWLWHI